MRVKSQLWLLALICFGMSGRVSAQSMTNDPGENGTPLGPLAEVARDLARKDSYRLFIDARPLKANAVSADRKHLAVAAPGVIAARRQVIARAGIADTNALVPLGRCLRASGIPAAGSREDCPADSLVFVIITLPARRVQAPTSALTARMFLKYISPYGFGERVYDCALVRRGRGWRVESVKEWFPPGPVM